MRDPIICSEEAEQINRRIQQEVDARLFVCCHYEPISYAISDDAFFMESIDNLYRFAIDSSYLIKNTKCIPNFPYRNLKDLKDQIDMLRSFKDHNQSDSLGQNSIDKISQFEEWISNIINKEKPSTISDYTELNKHLLCLSSKLISEINKLIDCCASFPNRRDLVQELLSKICLWYSTNTKVDIYKGFLFGLYLSESRSNYYTIFQLNRWLESTMTSAYTNKKQQLSVILSRIKRALRNKNALASVLSDEEISSLENLKPLIEKYLNQINKVLSLRRTVQDNMPFISYLVKEMDNHIKETIIYLDSQNIEYNMLPENIMNKVINRYVYCEFCDDAIN